MPVRKLTEKRGWAWTVAVGILKPPLLALMRRDWRGAENLPATGGCVVVFNHISHVDPLIAAHFLYDNGRIARYLAKSGLFKNRALGGFLRSAGQIPVERESANAKGAYAAAVDAIRAGQCVVVYPEGSLTRDPDGWPMRGKSGAARIALETGCPVIPVGQWGAQEILPAYSAKPDFLPLKTVHLKAGPPVDLGDLLPREHTPEVVAEATDRIMAALTAEVALLRGQEPPAVRFDPTAAGFTRTGNYKKRRPSA